MSVSLAEVFLLGIHPGWAKLLAQTPGVFEAACKMLPPGNTGAAPEAARCALEPLRFFAPENTRAVVVGLDLARAPGNFRAWAAQGVLVLPAPWVHETSQGAAAACPHRTHYWRVFTELLIGALCRLLSPDPVPFLKTTTGDQLWLTDVVPRDALAVLDWPRDAEAVNHILASRSHGATARTIQWDDGGSVLACDGACSKNGSPDAKAGFGVVATAGPLAGLEISGPVLPYLYEWVDPLDPLRGFRAGRTAATPTNNRGEYLAMCYLLLAICRAGLAAPVEVVTDSEVLYKTLLEWLPMWIRKGQLAKKKNTDLVLIAGALHARAGPITLVHINSHQSAPARPAGGGVAGVYEAAYRQWHANDAADVLAGRGREAGRLEVSPPFWVPGA